MIHRCSELYRQLQLLQLADSGMPIGTLSHSFGLETMVEDQLLQVEGLSPYLENLLSETLLLEALFCRTAHSYAQSQHSIEELNDRLSAIRCARESREASLAMGKRYLRLVCQLRPSPQLRLACELTDVHFSIAFGYACGLLLFKPDLTVGAFLSQSIAASLSAAQRLFSLGQMQSSQIAWDLKPLIEKAVAQTSSLDIESVSAFSHLPELASMRHPFQVTRLFIS